MNHKSHKPNGWDPVAAWYDGWVGKHGSDHHRQYAIPAVMEMLELQPGEHILDIGAGQGVLAPHITGAAGCYTGVDISPKLIRLARKHHQGHFIVGDARHLDRIPQLKAASFDAAVFLLSIQDMNPLDAVLQSAVWALKPGGRVVILMTHPCFRIPRQSGWGYDESRKLRYRRVDRYLTPLSIPVKPYTGRRTGVTMSFHRPLSAYINTMAACGLLLDCLREITADYRSKERSDREIPLFMGLRGRRGGHS